ncbi:MAG: hypothetical protein ACLT1W_11365 [Alistipes onderdonkii]
MDEAAVSAAIVAAVAAKDEEIANLKAAKETAEAEIARLRKEKEDAVAAEAVSFADALVKAGKISADARDAASRPSRPTRRTPARSSAAYRNARALQPGRDAGRRRGQVCREVVGRAGPCRTARRLKANHPDLYEKKYKEMAASLHICRG